jgi:tetratricopeptide (TPR) repeat protein
MTSPSTHSTPPGPRRRGRALAINLTLAAASLAVFVALSEGLLALVGIKPLAQTEDPYFGFAAGQPLFLKTTTADGTPRYETNPVKLTHFNFQSFPVKKSPGTFRIFTLGGSTTYGHPWRDSTSFTGWLRELLAGLDTSASGSIKRFEVINAGGISYASYRAARLADELARFEPDLFIVYNGHNEFLEERTYREARNIPAWMRNISGLLDHTRTYSLLRKLASAGKPVAGDTLAAEVDDVLARTIGPSSYTRDDALRAQVLAHYEEAQIRIGRIATAAGARVIYMTTPSNEKDCSPFKSEVTPGLSGADSVRSIALQGEARGLMDSDPAAAFKRLNAALTLDPRNAGLHYAAGRAALAAGLKQDAQTHFRRAIDEDVCPLRALTPMREIERRVARTVGGGFVDFEDTLRAAVAPRQGHTVLGEPDFTDHVHLTVEHYGLMARGILQEMRRMKLLDRVPDSAVTARAARRVRARLTPDEEGLGFHNIAKVLNWGGKTEEAARAARRGLELDSLSLEAVSSHQLAGADDERSGRADRAITHYLRALALDSNNGETRRLLGQALVRRGQPSDLSDAERHLTAAWQLSGGKDPSLAEQVGRLALEQRRYEEAIGPLRSAAALSGGEPTIVLLLTQALLSANRVDEAARDLQSLVQKYPRVAEGWMRLGMIAEFQGQLPAATQYYLRATQADPTHAAAQEALGRLTGR